MTEQPTLTQEGSLETSGKDGTFRFPGGTVKELSYFLPGYKKVIVDQETYKDSIEKIFEFLEIVGEKPQSIPYSPMDSLDWKEYEVKIYSRSSRRIIILNI